MQAIASGNRQLYLDAIIQRLVETVDGIVDAIEGLSDLGIVIADIDDRRDHCAAALTERTADVICGERANGVGTLRTVYKVEGWTDG